MTGKRRRRLKIGDVYAIPLPNGKYAFGRVYKDAGFGVYEHIGNSIDDLPDKEEFLFNIGVYKDVLTSGKWDVVENRPFSNEEEAFPPPKYIQDKILGKYSIYHKGEIKEATKEECKDLEVAGVWDEQHIIDRIMGEDKWH
ncbi:Imm26 family immunity protein [Alkalihalobacillus deserti]|uniref:Imm26 family immunity protein n=1 Tax=Alkalihalobacillus deserti TaxID=2879466 RepID=UPI001D15D5C2|nr:Imm26 family immunity protein [Alkalihalobacillus deserti]